MTILGGEYFEVNVYDEPEPDSFEKEWVSTGIYDKNGDLRIEFPHDGMFDTYKLDKCGYGKFRDYTLDRECLYSEQGKVVLEAEEIESYDNSGAVIIEGGRSEEGLLPEDRYALVNMEGEELINLNEVYQEMAGNYEFLTSYVYYGNEELILSVLGGTKELNTEGYYDEVFKTAETRIYNMDGTLENTLEDVGAANIYVYADFNSKYMVLYDTKTEQYNRYNHQGEMIEEDYDNSFYLVDYEYYPSNVIGEKGAKPIGSAWGQRDLLFDDRTIIHNVKDGFINGRAQVVVSENDRKVIDSYGNTVIPSGTYDSYVLSEEVPYIIARYGEKSDIYDGDGIKINNSDDYSDVTHISTFAKDNTAYTYIDGLGNEWPTGSELVEECENLINKENVILADNANGKVEILKIVDSDTVAEVKTDKDMVTYGEEFTLTFTPKAEVASSVDIYVEDEKITTIKDVKEGIEQTVTIDTAKQEIPASLYNEEKQSIYVRGSKTNEGTMIASGEVTLEKKEAIVKADSITVSLGDAMPEFTHTVSGLVGEEQLNVELTTSVSDTSNKGGYDIVVGDITFDESGYYNIEKQNGKLTVEYTAEDASEELEDVVTALPEVGGDKELTETDKANIANAGGAVVEELSKLDASEACGDKTLVEQINKVDEAFVQANPKLIAEDKELKIADEVEEGDKLPEKTVDVKGLGLSVFHGKEISDDTYFGINVEQQASEGSTLVLHVKPYMKVGKDGTETVINNESIQTPVTFKVYLNTEFSQKYVIIKHYSDEGGAPEEITRPVLEDEGGKYVELTVSHFSKFEVIPTQLYKKGDVNCDGRVDIGDVTRLYAHLNGTSPLEDEELGNLNGDTDTDISDVTRLYAELNGTNKFE